MVAARVVDQVLLMVAVSREEVFFWSNLELGDDFLALGVEVLLLNLIGHLLRNIHLLLVVCEDGRSVLCSSVVSLSVELSGVMCTIEELDQLSVRHLSL